MLKLPPELVEIIKTVPFSEIIEAVKTFKKPKRGKGRPAIAREFEILNAATLAKVRDGRYTQIARRFKLTPDQLINLVRHNRTYFTTQVNALRKNAAIKA